MECLTKLTSYPRSLLVMVPNRYDSVRVHLHGFILGLLPEYESSLSDMVRAFDLQQRICENQELVVIPESIDKCETYEHYFKDRSSLELIMDELELTGLPLHLSAHSGGGKTVARLLDSGLRVDKVSIYDGVYSQAEKMALKSWYERGHGKLNLSTVKGMTPDRFVNELKAELHDQSRLRHFSRETGSEGSLKAHYLILTETWE